MGELCYYSGRLSWWHSEDILDGFSTEAIRVVLRFKKGASILMG